MAVISRFEADDRSFKSLHPTRVVARYLTAESDGKKILQLNTYGSNNRQVPGKLSQTIQIDQSAAEELFQILKKEFRLK